MDRGLPKILNFGLAPPSIESETTVLSKFVNTLAYLSPALLSYEEIDQRTDIWSWGVVFYEMLTGHACIH
jgi:serine/threonine protein kinase